MNTLLRYDITTNPFPLQASAATGNPSIAQVTIVASNPTPANPVTLEGLAITVPVGTAATDLTSQSTGIGPVPPVGWTLKETQTSSASVIYIFEASSGQGQVGSTGLSFIFNNIEINSQPGTALIEVMEGSGDCKPPNCPTKDLQLTKFPNGWGEVTYWTNPSPPIIPYNSGVTLNWSGPAGATYTIEYYTPQTGVVNVPASGQPALANEGQYPASNDPQLQLTVDTTFYLNVVETINKQSYSAQQQITATVEEPLPKITLFQGTIQATSAGYFLNLKWQASDTDYCTLTGDAAELDPSSPDGGYRIPVTRLDTAYTLTARNTAGSDTSQLNINWQLQIINSAQVSSSGGCVAVSPDGSRIYVLDHDNSLLHAVDGASLQPIAGAVSVSGFPEGIAISPDGTRLYVVSSLTGALSVFNAQTLASIAVTPITINSAAIAISADGARLYVMNIDNNLRIYDSQTLQIIGNPMPMGDTIASIAVSPDGARIFVMTTPGVVVLDASTLEAIGNPTPVTGFCVAMAFSPDGDRLYLPSSSGYYPRYFNLLVLDAATLEQVDNLSLGDEARAIACSPNEPHVYVTTYDGVLNVFSEATVTGGKAAA